MKTLEEIGKSAKAAEPVLRIMGTNQKNEALLHVAEKLLEEKAFVLAENVKEAVKRAKEYITQALEAGLDLGKGSGPMDHTLGGVNTAKWLNH